MIFDNIFHQKTPLMTNKFTISIPKPCNENWNTMSSFEKGKFCEVCSKSVIDFTNLNDDEIQDYILKNKEKKICGRFKNKQISKNNILQIPKSILLKNRTFHKAFLLSLFVVMGTTLFSCRDAKNSTIGEVAIIEDTISKSNHKPEEEILMGEVIDSIGDYLPPPPKSKVDEVKFIKPEKITTLGLIKSKLVIDSNKIEKR